MDQPATSPAFAAPVGPAHPRRPIVRWLAVVLALAGWFVSLELLKVSGGAATAHSPLLSTLCGGTGERDNCTSILTSDKAYFELGRAPGAPRVPVAALGMAYFAFVLLWYLFVGPPAYAGRRWHVLIGIVVLMGVFESQNDIQVMAFQLNRWCAGCLAAHALNGGIAILTLLAWPWRKPKTPTPRYPTARVALATATAGVATGVLHLSVALLVIAFNFAGEVNKRHLALVTDPAFVAWDFARQTPVDIPLDADETFAGDPDAPHTVVVFSDFLCPACRQLHNQLRDAAQRHPGQMRIAFRYYPQDPQCNPNPKFRGAGRDGACAAARYAEAVRLACDRDTYLRFRSMLYENQGRLHAAPYGEHYGRLGRLATEVGAKGDRFEDAQRSDARETRIARDVTQAERLGIDAVPVVYLDGRRIRGWNEPRTWDVLLGPSPTASAPSSAPATQP